MRAFYSNLYQPYLIKNTENLYMNKKLLKNQENNLPRKDSTLFLSFLHDIKINWKGNRN